MFPHTCSLPQCAVIFAADVQNACLASHKRVAQSSAAGCYIGFGEQGRHELLQLDNWQLIDDWRTADATREETLRLSLRILLKGREPLTETTCLSMAAAC